MAPCRLSRAQSHDKRKMRYDICKVNKGNLGHSFHFLFLLRREDRYLKANTIELTFTQCASSTANLMQAVASYERWETFSLI